jgi:hypothetical protein
MIVPHLHWQTTTCPSADDRADANYASQQAVNSYYAEDPQ